MSNGGVLLTSTSEAFEKIRIFIVLFIMIIVFWKVYDNDSQFHIKKCVDFHNEQKLSKNVEFRLIKWSYVAM